ncbi:MAG: Ig-like domain-containing protein [Pyrinomonadaceae bacterium]
MRFPRKRRPLLLAFLAAAALASLFAASAGMAARHARKGTAPVPRKEAGPRQEASPLPTPTPLTDKRPLPTPTPAPSGSKRPGKRVRVYEARSAQTLLASAGTLTGRVSTPPPPRSVNLTPEGTLDWAHWGNGGPQVFNHKAGVTQQISNYSVIGSATVNWLADNPTHFVWSDGTPTASVSDTQTGVWVSSGNGFEFTVPADTSLRTLRVYVGLWAAHSRLEASLSDESAPDYVDDSLINATGTTNGVYTISYSAASAGQTLHIRYTGDAQPSGNVTLEAATLVTGSDPDIFPVVAVASPSDGATFNAGEVVTLDANAFDPDGSITSVEFYLDGVYLGTGTPTGTNRYSFNWGNIFAGSYSLTAVATDDLGAKSVSEPVDVTALAVTGGSLTGTALAPSPPSQVNLTNQGTLDWAHWGNGGPQVFNHKAGVTQQISNFTRIGTSTTSWLADNLTSFSWTDGTPTATGTNLQYGVFASAVGNGFEFSVPADTSTRTLRVYTGLWSAQGRLEATLSDGSAPTFVDTSLTNSSASSNGVYTISYRAASAGQTLRIRYTVLTDFAAPFGNVTLEAATLVAGGDPNAPPTVSLTSPANGAVINAGSNVVLNASASDSDGTVKKVEFFRGGTKLGESTAAPYTTTWTNAPGGIYTLTAVATDDKGRTATSSPIGVQLNVAPFVSAGDNQSLVLPASAALFGSATDDGLPTTPGAVTLTWSRTSGPGTVSFGNAGAAVTTASFSSEGTYVLRLTANDGARTAFSEVTVEARTVATVKLTPTADAHVRDGASAATNFGTAATIEVLTSGTTGENRDAYFKFDLTNVGDISNAKLRVNAALSAAGSVTASVYPVSNTSWTEAAVNWNNRPALGSPALASVNVSGTAFAWYELDVTNYLVAEKSAGRSVVTLALHNAATSAVFIKINSKEAATNKPELSVVTPERAFVTGKTLGTLRNNLTGFVGMKFTTGAAPVTLTSLGRIFVSGNTGTHTVKVVNAGTSADVAGASVSVNTAAGTASNGFKYVALAAPVTLAANTAYYLVSQETSGGDQWYDSNTVLTTTSVAAVNNAVQRPSSSWVAVGGANNSHVPVDFKYTAGTPAQTAVYHLHKEASVTGGLFQLTTAGPDATSQAMQTANLQGQATGEKLINAFDTQSPVLGRAGYVPAGATATFTLWMKNTGTAGTMFPRVKLNLNGPTGTSVCTATGAAALTTTLTKYVLTCSVASNIMTAATDRYYLWVGVNLTAGSSNKTFAAELDVEGTLNGNYDSQVAAPSPLAPTIYALSPTLGPAGTSVTITGSNFGAMQGASTVAFNGLAAAVTSWSRNSVVANVPANAATGPLVVTVNGVASNGVTFTVGPSDSDGDGLPDVWEIQHFGNLGQGAAGDPDSDGVTNLQEYRRGSNPTKGAVADTNSTVNLKVHTPREP